jgi:hypothetical protein
VDHISHSSRCEKNGHRNVLSLKKEISLKCLDKRDAEFVSKIKNKYLRSSLLKRLNRARTFIFVSMNVISVWFLLIVVVHLLDSDSKMPWISIAVAGGLWAFHLLNFGVVDLQIKAIKFITDKECKETDRDRDAHH